MGEILALGTSPFTIFVWVAEAGSPVSAGEASAFQRLLGNAAWCRSQVVRDALTSTHAAYAALWKAHAARQTALTRVELQSSVGAVLESLEAADRASVAADLLHIAHSIARPNGLASRLRPLSTAVAGAIEELATILTATPVAIRSNVAPAPPLAAKFDNGVVVAARAFMPLIHTEFNAIPRWSGGKIHVRCVKVIPETHDVKTFRFAAEPPVLFSHRPGQFLTLELDIGGKRVLRSYTISSAPTSAHTIDITVKRVEGGHVSNHLHDTLKVGDPLVIAGCNGKFNCWDIPARSVLFISGGSGITPVMAMTRWLRDSASDCDIVFLHFARTPRDLIFQKELEWTDSQHANFRLGLVCSRVEPGQTWSGCTGRLSEQSLHALCPDYLERTVYVCGPQPFMEAARDLLGSLGFSMKRYHEESFGVAKPRRASDGVGEPAPQVMSPPINLIPTVERPAVLAASAAMPAAAKELGNLVSFVLSGKSVVCERDDYILDAAEQAGLDLQFSCRAGSCGTCKTKKLSGTLAMDCTDGLSEGDKLEDFVLICVSKPSSDVVLEA